eukprot:s3537_g6.t1
MEPGGAAASMLSLHEGDNDDDCDDGHENGEYDGEDEVDELFSSPANMHAERLASLALQMQILETSLAMEPGGAASMLPLHEGDNDDDGDDGHENGEHDGVGEVEEVFGSPANIHADRYASLVHIHRARPDVPMRAINSIANFLGLPQHDSLWCLGPGRPAEGLPVLRSAASSKWCLSGWILSREDLAKMEMLRAVLLLGCRLRLADLGDEVHTTCLWQSLASLLILTSFPVAVQGHWVEGCVVLSLYPALVEAHGLEMQVQSLLCLLTFLFACGVVCTMLPGGRRPARPLAGRGRHIFMLGGFPQNVARLISRYMPYGINAQIENGDLELENIDPNVPLVDPLHFLASRAQASSFRRGIGELLPRKATRLAGEFTSLVQLGQAKGLVHTNELMTVIGQFLGLHHEDKRFINDRGAIVTKDQAVALGLVYHRWTLEGWMLVPERQD